MEKAEIRLGQAVTFDPMAELVRQWMQVEDPHRKARFLGRKWVSYSEYFQWKGREPEAGVIVGTRTLQEGYTEHCYEEPSVWMPTGTLDVVLVAVNLRHAPKKFRAEDLEVML